MLQTRRTAARSEKSGSMTAGIERHVSRQSTDKSRTDVNCRSDEVRFVQLNTTCPRFNCPELHWLPLPAYYQGLGSRAWARLGGRGCANPLGKRPTGSDEPFCAGQTATRGLLVKLAVALVSRQGPIGRRDERGTGPTENGSWGHRMSPEGEILGLVPWAPPRRVASCCPRVVRK